MTHEMAINNVNMMPEWDWRVTRHDTVSDVSTLVAGGCEATSEAALGKAKAAMMTAMNEGKRKQ